MELSLATLEGVLAAVCGEEPSAPWETAWLARHREWSFAPTLYSAWEQAGRPLTPAIRYELDLQRGRIAGYRELSEKLHAAVPGLIGMKGLDVADRYPAGLLRYMNDLDFWVPDEAELWQAAALLSGWGWEVWQATFGQDGGRLRVLVSLRQPNDDPYAVPFAVEMTNYLSLGDLGGVAPLLDLPAPWRRPEIKNMVMLLLERFEQAYRARDLVDAALLLAGLERAGLRTLWSAIDRFRLWPEYAELAARIAGTPLPPAPRPRWLPAAVAAARIRRGAGVAGTFRRPADGVLRHLQRRLLHRGQRRPERWAWSILQSRLPAERALHAGMPLFGLPVDGAPAAGDRAVLGRRGRTVWADTPVGRFLLAPGDVLTEDLLDNLPADPRPSTVDGSTVDEPVSGVDGGVR
ncbi:MAG: hypothetical protein V7637_722 [Mycobacteriales bacterium]|jgi:hypothetical protein